MNAGSDDIAGAGTATEAPRLEEQWCRREPDVGRKRMEEEPN